MLRKCVFSGHAYPVPKNQSNETGLSLKNLRLLICCKSNCGGRAHSVIEIVIEIVLLFFPPVFLNSWTKQMCLTE